MVERLAVLLAVAALIAVAILLVRAWNARRLRHLLATSNQDAAPFWQTLGEVPDGRPTLVTFSTPSCAACHTAQAPAVSVVEQRLGAAEVRVIRVDAAARPEVARAFGVQTVPSTVVLAPAGRVVAVNQGFAPSRRLVEQLQRA
jgi:thioredoxin-like negative regulator of GroEL